MKSKYIILAVLIILIIGTSIHFYVHKGFRESSEFIAAVDYVGLNSQVKEQTGGIKLIRETFMYRKRDDNCYIALDIDGNIKNITAHCYLKLYNGEWRVDSLRIENLK